MRTFCTIITSDYYPYAVTLYRSLTAICPGEKLAVLVVDENRNKIDTENYPGITIFSAADIYNCKFTDQIFNKYSPTNPDALRWALKPVFIKYLAEQGYSKIIFADCDLFFFNNYEFLFLELDNYSLLLTPGRTTRNPLVHEEEFLSGYKYGHYNAGFIGATKDAIPILNWWAKCCAYRIETRFDEGLFVDQKYLDAAPVLFDRVGIIRHKGCNVAFWNQHECKRVKQNNGILINGSFPVIFIHFTNKYIPELLHGNDPHIYPYYLQFRDTFAKSGSLIDHFIPGIPEYKEPGFLLRIKKKLLIRTRIKRALFWLSQKL